MRAGLVKKGTIWFLRAVALSLLVLIAFVSYAIFEESYEKKQVSDEIEKLRAEAERIEKDNSQIREKIAYLESREFREKEARDKLNLQGEGEKLVVVKPSLSQETFTQEGDPSSGNEDDQVLSSQSKKENYKKWWDYFFKC
jgi:cell division protein FtsB